MSDALCTLSVLHLYLPSHDDSLIKCITVQLHLWFVLLLLQIKGVTDCISEAEKSGLLCRQEPLGYDRHTRKYWFLCRRIIV